VRLRHSVLVASLLASFAARSAAQTPPPPPPAPQTPAPAAAPAADSGRRVTIRGVVFDSLARVPLAGAVVQFAPRTEAPSRAFSATTDSVGEYRLEGLAPGRYLAGFFHPMLDSLGLQPPLGLADVDSGGASIIDLAIPGAERVYAAHCGARAPGDSSGLLLGWVHDADGGQAVPGGKVVLTWREMVFSANGMRLENKRLPVSARDDGFYALCKVPSGEVLVAGGEAGSRRSGLVEVIVPPGGVLRRNFALGDSTTAVVAKVPTDSAGAEEGGRIARGTATLTGVVRDPGGQALSGAQTLVWGSGVTGRTGEGGKFTLSNLPAGTYSLEVRAIGYSPKRVPVDLASRKTTNVEVTMDERATVLAGVTIKETRRTRDFDGFLRRQQNGMGRYVTREDIERRNPFVTTDVLRTMPGLSVTPTSGMGYAVRGRGGCTPAVVIDGTPVSNGANDIDAMVRPQDVRGMEVYLGLGGVPGEYATFSNGCGVILVWTGR